MPQQGTIAPQGTTTTDPRAETLGDKLARSDGVLCPPTGVDPEIRAPTSETGNMPVTTARVRWRRRHQLLAKGQLVPNNSHHAASQMLPLFHTRDRRWSRSTAFPTYRPIRRTLQGALQWRLPELTRCRSLDHVGSWFLAAVFRRDRASFGMRSTLRGRQCRMRRLYPAGLKRSKDEEYRQSNHRPSYHHGNPVQHRDIMTRICAWDKSRRRRANEGTKDRHCQS
jgi:hypothetical protein